MKAEETIKESDDSITKKIMDFIKANDKFETNIEGVYASGDVVGSFAQIVTAASEGAEAATNAYLYLKGGAYGKKIVFDYGEKSKGTR